MRTVRVMVVILFAAFLISVSSTAWASVTCYGIATYATPRQSQDVVFRSSRTADTEQEAWAGILFEDFASLERAWKSLYPNWKLTKIARFKGRSGPSSVHVLCFRGMPDRRVKNWPRATFPVMVHEHVAAAVFGVNTVEFDPVTGGWKRVHVNRPTFICKHKQTYQKIDGEDYTEPREVVHEKIGVIGNKTYAESQIRASVRHAVMRLTRGHFRLVSTEGADAGACWEAGTHKPPAPLGYGPGW